MWPLTAWLLDDEPVPPEALLDLDPDERPPPEEWPPPRPASASAPVPSISVTANRMSAFIQRLPSHAHLARRFTVARPRAPRRGESVRGGVSTWVATLWGARCTHRLLIAVRRDAVDLLICEYQGVHKGRTCASDGLSAHCHRRVRGAARTVHNGASTATHRDGRSRTTIRRPWRLGAQVEHSRSRNNAARLNRQITTENVGR